MVTKQLAGCVITDDSGRVLLIHRSTERLTQWELPGGKVESGETLAETAERENFEEVGVKVKVEKEIGQTNFEDDGVNWEYHWFLAKITGGKLAVMEPDKFDDLAYFNLLYPNLPYHKKLSPNIINLIAYLKSNKPDLSDIGKR